MKVVLKVDTIWSWVNGDKALDIILYEKLSVLVEGYRYSKLYQQGLWDGKKHFYDIYRKRFLTGLLTKVVNLITEAGYEVEVINKENVFTTFGVNDVELNNIDVERFNKVQLPLLQRIAQQGRCAVKLATGGGKTELMAGLCSALRDKKVLVIVHRLELLEQTRKRLQERLGEKIGKIESDGIEIKERVVVGMVMSILSKMSILTDYLKNDVDALLMDEVHHASADSWAKIAMICNAKIRVGFSGTPIMHKAERDLLLIGLTGEVIEGMSVNDLADLGYAVKPVIRIIKDDRLHLYSNNRKYGLTYSNLIETVYNNINTLEVVGEVVRAHNQKGLVIFVDRISVGNNIYRYLANVLKMQNIEFSNGNTDKLKRLNVLKRLREGKVNVLIATPILDEGVDVAGVTGVLFMCSNKSIVKIMQRIGRGVRTADGKEVVYVYDLNIRAPWLTEHLAHRLKLYSEENFTIEVNKINTRGGIYEFEKII